MSKTLIELQRLLQDYFTPKFHGRIVYFLKDPSGKCRLVAAADIDMAERDIIAFKVTSNKDGLSAYNWSCLIEQYQEYFDTQEKE